MKLAEIQTRHWLRKLAIRPRRPWAYDSYYAGTRASMDNTAERDGLNALVRQGLAEQTKGGWYRITDAGRACIGITTGEPTTTTKDEK